MMRLSLIAAGCLVVAALIVGGWVVVVNAIDAHHREPSTHTPVEVAWLPLADDCVPQPAPPTWGCEWDEMPVLFCDGTIRCLEGWQR